jgi:hypothetical protein
MMRASQRRAPKQVGGDFAGCVADEEYARAHAEDSVAEVEIDVHLQGCEADVDAVHVGDAVA